MLKEVTYWKFNYFFGFLLCLSLALIGVTFFDGMQDMGRYWKRDEYSHGPLIPFITIFFIWQHKNKLESISFDGSFLGLALLVFGLLLGLVGTLSTIYMLVHYGVIISLIGLVISITGKRGFFYLAVPLFLLLFMVPLPQFFYLNLSQKLQLLSSAIGVDVIRLFNVSVYLEGNVIDLGSYKLQVVDACSGLRYLFPLMSFGLICAYLFKAPLWQRTIVFFSTIPITVLMNSFRIGVIGVLVDRFGQEQAEGFLHDFEGWVIFMACVVILFFEMWLLNKIFNRDNRELREVFGLEFPEPNPEDAVYQVRPIPKTFIISIIILSFASVGSLFIDERQEIIPERTNLNHFPSKLDKWNGKPDKLGLKYIQGLTGLTDHIIGDYQSDSGAMVNLYVAYYESQRAGGSIHSPKSCIPGGGWVIESIDQVLIHSIEKNGEPLKANRVRIAKGDYKQLVYYWFDQRGRHITNEYLLKWFLFWDSLTKHRSDGALIRLTTMIGPNESWGDAESKLDAFASALGNKLDQFIPQ